MAKYNRFYSNVKEQKVIGTINVTPFVDVMLVLLIIFMVSAPLLVTGVNVNLPSNAAAPAIDQQNPFSLAISANGKITHEEQIIELDDIESFVKANVLSKTTKILVKGDRNVDYGMVMKVISRINKAGYKKVALATESSDKD
jgi:biopolymer transport protein TolR